MNSEKDRKAFEEWYEKHHNGRQISCDYLHEDNSYSAGYANAIWVGWQASVNREGYKLVPVEPDRKKLHSIALAIMKPAGTVHDVYKAAIVGS